MKTNVIMRSELDRNLFGVVIRQETKTGFMNLSDLQLAYNNEARKNGWPLNRRYYDLLTSEANMERIYYLAERRGFIKTGFPVFMELSKTQPPAKLLKKIGVYKSTGARKNATVWADPSVFVLLAMEMNPKFYAEVVSWLTDKLIINRIEAGNFYRALSSSIAKWNPDGNQYITLAKALNYIVFGRHEAGIRNSASAKELKQLEDLEKKIAFAIDMGYIRSWNMMIEELRKIYKQKKAVELPS